MHHAVVDSSGSVLLDADPVNNSRLWAGSTRGLVRLGFAWGVSFQNLLHSLTAF